MLASVETATLQGRRAIAAGVDAKVWVAAECNRYIFSRQVKPDRQQLLPTARALSFSSKNTATTKAQIRSGSPAIANMPPIALSVAVVDRLRGPGLVRLGVPAPACSSPSATNSPGYPTSLTIAESDFDSCRTIGAIVLL